MVVSGSNDELFAHGDEFPLAIFVILGGGIESIVNSSMSCEESGRVLTWHFQFDSIRFELFRAIGLVSGT